MYGVLYLCFVAYPIIFQLERGWQTGLVGSTFCFYGIRVGSLMPIFAAPVLRKVTNAYKADLLTGRPPLEAVMSSSVSAVCSSPIVKSSLPGVSSQCPLDRSYSRRTRSKRAIRSWSSIARTTRSKRTASMRHDFSAERTAAKRHGVGSLLGSVRMNQRLESI